jgi:hypothetical protein
MNGAPWKTPKEAVCPGCGKLVELVYSFTNQCEPVDGSEGCEQHMNGYGQAIRPPGEWEEPWDDF